MREAAERLERLMPNVYGSGELTDYLRLASPKNVIALLDALEIAERALEPFAQAFDRFGSDTVTEAEWLAILEALSVNDFRNASKAKITALKGEAS